METRPLTLPSFRWPDFRVAGIFLLLMAVIVLNAWVSDDAYITFRVVDHFLAGYGLRWNIDERVQSYTHPLWMMLHVPLYAVWHNIFLVTITLSLVCTAAAIALALRTFDRPAHLAVLCLLLPLALSKVFVEFSTSGLENPLSHLLFACFGFLLIRKEGHPYFWFYCSLVIALAMLNRLDTIILYLPPLAWIVLSRFRAIRWGQVMLGALPLLGWFAFSLLYYGFLFPNTKYAKLNTGISGIAYLKQGVLYFFELFSSDAFTYMIFCVMLARMIDSIKDVVAARVFHKGMADKQQPSHLFLSIGLGIASYMAYTVVIGGDFMSGRFFSLPYFATAWLIYGYITEMPLKRAAIFTAFLAALKYLSVSMAAESLERCMSSIENPFPTYGYSFCTKSGIADERAFYTPTRVWFYNGSFDSNRIMADRTYWLVQNTLIDPDEIYLFGPIGVLGYYAGPKLRLIDYYALTDPLLARLPIRNVNDWRIGHFERAVPDGYMFAIRHNRLDQMHPALAAYYAPLRLIVTGDLFDLERLKAIIAFNLGHYDHFKEEYLRAEHAITD